MARGRAPDRSADPCRQPRAPLHRDAEDHLRPHRLRRRDRPHAEGAEARGHPLHRLWPQARSRGDVDGAQFRSPRRGRGQANRMRHLRWEGAVINHYAVRSRDIFLLKNHRGDGMRSAYNKRYFLHSRWHRAANANDTWRTAVHPPPPARREGADGRMARRRSRDRGARGRRPCLAAPDAARMADRGRIEELTNPAVREVA
jgi:hypothetical protein